MQKKLATSVRVSLMFYEHAKDVAQLKHRSIPSQIEYWSTLGIILEKKYNEEEINAMLLEHRKTDL